MSVSGQTACFSGRITLGTRAIRNLSVARPCYAFFPSPGAASNHSGPWRCRQLLPSSPRRCSRQQSSQRLRCRADKRLSTHASDEQQADEPGSNLTGSLALGLVYAALAGYAFFLSPNQTPFRDQYFIQKLVGLGASDGVSINTIVNSLFFIMGIWPVIYAAVLIPSARSKNKVPAWPFVTASFAVGIFALGPYFALWSPDKNVESPPRKEELEGWQRFGLKITESRLNGVLLLVGALVLLGQAATAGTASWTEYFRLFDESRFIHVMSLDFLLLTCFAPFWLYNDATARQWEPRDKLLPILSVLPVVGPAIYLILRPRTE